MHMWSTTALVFYCPIIMVDFSKYSFFENVFDYGSDHIVKIFDHSQQIIQGSLQSLRQGIPFRLKFTDVNVFAGIE